MAIAQKYLSYLDLKARMAQEAAAAEKEIPVMDLVESTNMTDKRKIEILDSYISQLQSDLESANKKREEIAGEAASV